MSDHSLSNDANHVAELIGASKVYKNGPTEIVALHPTDLVLNQGEMLLIIGPSGSGKTTLLSLIGCVLYPTKGCVCIQGTNTKDLSDRQLARLRREKIGFVFQNYNLIGPLTSEDNVRVPLILNKLPKEEIQKKSHQALHTVGLDKRKKSIPKQLSGGEQQRVAIARALVNEPSIILCDEPTASLDSDSMGIVMDEVRKLADSGKAVAVVTHDLRLKDYADKIIYLEHGKLVNTKEGQ
jgi:putative ABC transport system ATP-binding protein